MGDGLCGTESASYVQAGAVRKLDSQDHGLPRQRYDRPSLVSGKGSFREDLLLLAKAAISYAVGTTAGDSAACLCVNYTGTKCSPVLRRSCHGPDFRS